jgi:hypothetical protein
VGNHDQHELADHRPPDERRRCNCTFWNDAHAHDHGRYAVGWSVPSAGVWRYTERHEHCHDLAQRRAASVYFVKNGSGQSVVLSQGSGTTVTVADGKSAIVYADGGGAGANVVDLTSTFNFQPLTATLTAIGALAVTDGNIIVGNGSTWVAESGATARTSLGLGSGDNVTFAQVDIAATGDLRLQDTTGGEYVALQAPGTVSASYTLTLPAADGTSGQALVTNGSGTLSFAAAGISTGKAIAMAIVFG